MISWKQFEKEQFEKRIEKAKEIAKEDYNDCMKRVGVE